MNIASFTLVMCLGWPILWKIGLVIGGSKTRKNQMKYIEAVFLWFFLPYNGWRVIKNNGDKDIEEFHSLMKVI